MTRAILVGAPGSLLSTTAARLGREEGVSVIDVEKLLLDNLTPEDGAAVNRRRGNADADMAALTRAFPREKVLALWADALGAALSLEHKNSHVIIACHLTLYRNDRSEFYSTVGQLLRKISEAAFEVDEVVQLIDDIYDMYSRLSDASKAMSAESGFRRWQDFTAKGTPAELWKKIETSETEHLAIEARAQALQTLLDWRHQESVLAESLASSIGSRFTVFGVKHSYQTLQSLVLGQEHVAPRTVYVSHPISAYRRTVNQALAGGEPYEWPDGVRDCNSIPALLEADRSLVAIMPTAIDELRLRGLSGGADRLTQRSPFLGPRWPLMNAGVGLTSSPDAQVDIAEVEHEDLVIATDSTLADEPYIGEIARMLEARILAEVPYRDHLIVANSGAFLVHRPLADKARLSRGVEHEVRHWRDRRTLAGQEIRLAIVHVADDVAALRARTLGQLATTSTEDNQKLRRNTRQAVQLLAGRHLEDQHGFDYEEREAILAGRTLGVDPLGGRPEFTSDGAVARAREDAIVEGIRGLVLEQLSLLDKLDLPGVAVFLVSRDVVLDASNMSDVRDFLSLSDVPEKRIIATIQRGEVKMVAGNDILIEDVVMQEFLGLDPERIDFEHDYSRRSDGLSITDLRDSRMRNRLIKSREAALEYYGLLSEALMERAESPQP